MKSKQKFNRGDLVHVARDLGPSMSHFTSNVDAIVDGSYAEVCNPHFYGDEDHLKKYCLFLLIPGNGSIRHVSWYHEHQLTLIRKRTLDSIERVEKLLRKE